jgi:hypothetical protein
MSSSRRKHSAFVSSIAVNAKPNKKVFKETAGKIPKKISNHASSDKNEPLAINDESDSDPQPGSDVDRHIYLAVYLARLHVTRRKMPRGPNLNHAPKNLPALTITPKHRTSFSLLVLP